VKRARIEFPLTLLERELDNLLEEQDRFLRQQESLTLDNWLEINKKSKEEHRDELRPQAAERLKRGLALGKVAELEGITVEEEEIEAQIERMSPSFGEQADEARNILSSADNRRSIASNLLTNKALQRLMAIAKGEVETETKGEIDEVDETAGPEEAQVSETEAEPSLPAEEEETARTESAEGGKSNPAD
jgi:trigger factor